MRAPGLNRYSVHGTALLILAANAPDVDIVALANGHLAYLEAHRGYTHSLIGLPVMALLSMLVIAAIFRRKLPWLKAWLLCCVGVASHLMLDWTNSYGMRLLLPFSSRWFHLDVTALYDGWIMAALFLAAVWPFFSRLVSREIGGKQTSGRSIAVTALFFVLLFDIARGLLHARAVAQLEARLFENGPPIQASAMPESFSPFAWRGIVETASTYASLPVNTLGDLDISTAHVFYKPPNEATLDAAKRTEAFRYFDYFARFPVWAEFHIALDHGQGERVELTDLRFGQPEHGSFHCVAVEDTAYHVLQSTFTFGSGFDIGWGKDGPPPDMQR